MSHMSCIFCYTHVLFGEWYRLATNYFCVSASHLNLGLHRPALGQATHFKTRRSVGSVAASRRLTSNIWKMGVAVRPPGLLGFTLGR